MRRCAPLGGGIWQNTLKLVQSFMIVQMVWCCDDPVEGFLVEWLCGHEFKASIFFFLLLERGWREVGDT